MGIVNVTPDSFSDGGRFQVHDAAIAQALQLAADGAVILDIGGESTRPYATPVSTAEELARVIPVIERVAGRGPLYRFPLTPPKQRSRQQRLSRGRNYQ